MQGFDADDPLHPQRVNFMQLNVFLVTSLNVFKTLMVLLGLNVELVFVNIVLLMIPYPVLRKRLLIRRFISILTKRYLLVPLSANFVRRKGIQKMEASSQVQVVGLGHI